MIEKFIEKIGKTIEIIDKDKVSKAYQEFINILNDFGQSVEEFLKANNFEKAQIMHFYLVEKIFSKVF